MRKEELCEIIGDINENHIKDARKHKKSKESAWIKWGTMVACLTLIAGVGLIFVNDLTDSYDTTPTETVLLIEYQNAYYEVIEHYQEELKHRGVVAEITKEVAGKHIAYLQKENAESERSNYVVAQTETDIELLEYAPVPYKAVRILRDGDKYFAALFQHYLISDEECLPVTSVFEIYGINMADDIASITPIKPDNSWSKTGNAVTERDRIVQFYNEIVSLEAYREDAYHEMEFDVHEDDSESEIYTKHADDRKDIMIETEAGLRFRINYYPVCGWISADATQSYYKMTSAIAEWFRINL